MVSPPKSFLDTPLGQGPLPITTVSQEEISAVLQKWGEPAFRVQQIWEWVHNKHAFSFNEMTNLSKSLREKLARNFILSGPIERAAETSLDDTRKYLLEFPGGTCVECVGMPYRKRYSVCLSAQAGCAMKCAFCATGKGGFKRNLSSEEIVQQAAFIQKATNKTITSVVLMGQGEPFLNYDSSLAAMRELNNPDSFSIGARHITVSTAGIIPGITRFSQEPEQFGLAVSLHSAIQETRNRLMPGVKKYSLSHLYDALQFYTEKTNRRVTYEYLMIAGVNDTDASLDALIDFCAETLCHVDLIALNPVEGSSFEPSPKSRMTRFVQGLSRSSVQTTIRHSKGKDIDAACGQLAQTKPRSATSLDARSLDLS